MANIIEVDFEFNIGTMWHELAKIAQKLAEDWFKEQTQNEYGAYYLWFKESTKDKGGSLVVAEERPEGFTLAHSARIMPHYTIEVAQYWINEYMRNLPIFKKRNCGLAVSEPN